MNLSARIPDIKIIPLLARIEEVFDSIPSQLSKKVSAIRFSTLNALCKELNCLPAGILEYVND